MRVGVIGVGQAGGRIADLLAYHSKWGTHGEIAPFSLVVNAAQADLLGLKTIPKKNRILVGQTLVKGHGAGLHREVGAQVARQGLHMVMHAVSDEVVHHVDAFLVIVGLGGGTGSGGAPIIARRLKEAYPDPVFALGILPGGDEGEMMTRNAIECLRELCEVVDGVLLFDNDVWRREGQPLETSYSTMNYELIKPLPILLGAGEASNSRVGIKVVDASDIIATWKGLSFIGYSALNARTIKDRLLFFKDHKSSIDQLSPALRCYTVIRNAATLRLTGECDIKKAKRALMIIAGPPRELNMEGFRHAKEWLESAIGTSEVRGGDYPIKGATDVAGVVLLSGFPDIPRLLSRWMGGEAGHMPALEVTAPVGVS